MRDTISPHLNNLSRMDSLNDTVIIYDPTPEKKKTPKRKGKPKNRRINPISNLKKKTTNMELRVPLRTVYESCSRDVQNTCNNNSAATINLVGTRLENDSEAEINLPRKKQKIIDPNETIIILSDTESGPSIQSRESDIIVVDDTDQSICQSPPESKAKIGGKRKRAAKKLIQAKDPKKTKSNDEDEEIAVVWASTSGNELANEQISHPSDNSNAQNMFFVDTTGDKSNHERECLIDDNELCSPTSPITQEQLPINNKITNKKNKSKDKLREIIVDGCNVAFGFSHQNHFSHMGLKLVLDYFRTRGHNVKIFLPQNQRKKGREYLESWYRQGYVVFTPGRIIGGKTIVPYDDRFIVDYATKCKGIIVSSDQYRDLWHEKPEWRETIEERLLAPTFVGNYVMFAEDPLGRRGPKLDQFLKY